MKLGQDQGKEDVTTKIAEKRQRPSTTKYTKYRRKQDKEAEGRQKLTRLQIRLVPDSWLLSSVFF